MNETMQTVESAPAGRAFPVEEVWIEEAVDGCNAGLATIALSRSVDQFWLPPGDLSIEMNGQPRSVTDIDDVLTGEQSRRGIRLRIDPDCDPAHLFRCVV